MSGQHSADPVEYSPDKGQEGDSFSAVIRLIAVGMAVEGPVDLPVVIAIASEDVLQELQLSTQTLLIAQSSVRSRESAC